MISGKCIVCEADKNGFPIIDDTVIKTIRAVKKKLKMAKGNTLIVCPVCVEPYKKKRADFEKALVQYGLLGAFLLLLLVAVPLFIGGSFNLATVAMAVLLALLIFAFSIFRYYPAADLTGYIQPAQSAQQAPAQAASPASAVSHQPAPSQAPKNLMSLFGQKPQQHEKHAEKKPAQKEKKKK